MSDRVDGRGGQRRRTGPFVPFVRFEDVVVRCGHVEKFGLMPDGQDRFREGRRQKLIGRDCKACRQKKQLEEAQANEQRRVQRELRKAQQAAPKKKRPAQDGRLPDGSPFEEVYDGPARRWSGTLRVPTPGGASAFTGSASGLFTLLSELDRQYRAAHRTAAETAPA